MQIDLRLIRLYSFIQECYDNELCWYCQRFSPNGHNGFFTDVELLTCYFFAMIEEEKHKMTGIHSYIQRYWKDWFPEIPSYQAFNNRMNRLSAVFPLFLERLSEIAMASCEHSNDFMMDSFPVILCSGKRNFSGHIWQANKGYCSSKSMYYHGVKVHCIGMRQVGCLPLPVWFQVTPASVHDAHPYKEAVRELKGANLFADKAYGGEENISLANDENVTLFSPVKDKRCEPDRERFFERAYRNVMGRAVSSVRQPIESLFNWIIEKVDIQNASKVRSSRGLDVHIMGRFSAALMIRLGFNSPFDVDFNY
ncbi:transposase (plasmid) [Fulvitalea axinellae]|uniref:Transposase n=1 Tax=Fulvitalea axinellae TaxID=1182444 RepID=A0AAU9CZ66_9BACT|nr:transposase [Fulvitalea axinellae]